MKQEKEKKQVKKVKKEMEGKLFHSR